MSATEELIVEQCDGILTLTLNRPDRLNAISGPMLAALSAELDRANVDPEVRGLDNVFLFDIDDLEGVVSSNRREREGEIRRVEAIVDEELGGFLQWFSSLGSGEVIRALREQASELQAVELHRWAARLGHLSDEDGAGSGDDGPPDLRLFDLHNTPPLVLHRMDKPVVCALNGPAAGYGMDMALGCDIRIASDRAKLGAVFVRRGVLPESGGTWYLPRLLGWAKAAEVAFMGDVLDAERSLELGLVNRVVPHDQLMEEAGAVAARIASNAPYSVQATKRMMRLGMDETFETAVDHTYLQLRPMFGSEDFREGMAAFLERRDPAFQGR